jgi:uncharacterized protein YkvS
MKEVKIGHKYRCLPVEFKNEMSGTVMKIYENTVLILVEDYKIKDRIGLLDKHNRVIVKKENILYEEELNVPAVA